MTPTNLLVVGLVRGAAIAREIRDAPDLRVAGLVDIDAERLAAVGDALGVAESQRYLSYERALGECDAEIALLAVPTPLHKEYSLAALRAGRHVICEKPLALNLAEARELRDEIGRFDRRFMVGEQYRFAAGVESLRRAVADGRIGGLAYVAHEFYRGARVQIPGNPRRDEWMSAYQEPSLQEMSVHHFDMWYCITGRRCEEVLVKPFDPPWNNSNRKLGYSVLATLEGGVHVHYLTSRALSRPQTTWFGNITLVGQEGTLAWDGLGPVTLSRVAEVDDLGGARLAVEEIADVDSGPAGSTATAMVRALVDAIRSGRRHPCDIDDNFVSFATSIAAAESARTGLPVKVVET